MSVQVSTTQYEFSHGKQPRGYGQWAFFFDDESEPLWFTGRYSEAKQRAVAYALTKKHSKVSVGS